MHTSHATIRHLLYMQTGTASFCVQIQYTIQITNINHDPTSSRELHTYTSASFYNVYKVAYISCNRCEMLLVLCQGITTKRKRTYEYKGNRWPQILYLPTLFLCSFSNTFFTHLQAPKKTIFSKKLKNFVSMSLVFFLIWYNTHTRTFYTK